jgi:hypothetical protein
VSNAQKKKATTYSLKSYKDAAKKVADEKGPFVLEVDTDTSITIARPDGNTLLAVEEARSSREVINLICGDHAPEIFELFGPEDYTALNQFGDDLREHFEIGL